MPILTPATQTSSDLRCFPEARLGWKPQPGPEERTPVFPLVLGSVGAASVATFIGFRVGGASLFGNGNVSTPTLDAVRVDFAIANVALAVGLTSLVTAVVLALVHH